jgi:hypothetical protein
MTMIRLDSGPKSAYLLVGNGLFSEAVTMKKLGFLFACILLGLCFTTSAKADGLGPVDPTMVVGGAGGCGTPTVSIGVPFTFAANSFGGSNSTECPTGTFPGSIFKNGTASTITSLTVTTGIPIGDPCLSDGSFFSGGNLFTSAACSYNSDTQIATIIFSGTGPCGSFDIQVADFVSSCSGIAPGADFFVSLGTSGWLGGSGGTTPEVFSGVASVPEPASLLLLAIGLSLLSLRRPSRQRIAA